MDKSKSSHPDVGEQLVASILDKNYSIDGNFEPTASFPQDPLGKRLEPYMLRLLTGGEFASDNLVLHTGTQYGLPPPAIADALIASFFHNFIRLYPVVDELQFRALYQQYSHNQVSLDEQSQALIFMVMAVGAAVANDMFDQEQVANIRFIRESVFTQAMAASHSLYGHENIQNVQVLVLFSFYSLALKNMNSSWFWCGCAIRQLKTIGQRNYHTPAANDDTSLKDRLLYSIFILEKQLSILQFRSDVMLTIEDIGEPSEALKSKNLLLFLRLQLTCLTHRFCVVLQPGSLHPVELADTVEQLYVEMSSWCNSLQAGHQPGGDIYAESSERQFVLLMHIEYHGLLLAMFTTLEMTARILPKYTTVKKHNSIRIRNHSTIRINNARRLLHTVSSIVDTAQLWSQVICWLNISQVLPSFAMLYAEILKRPSLLSARSDAELLVVTSQVVDNYLATTTEKKAISDIMRSMAASASSLVTNLNPLSSGMDSERTSSNHSSNISSSSTYYNSTSPVSPQDPTAPTSDTPLSFYFNIAPESSTRITDTSSREQQHITLQTPRQALFSASSDQAPQAAGTLPSNDFPMDPRLWYPPY